MAHEAFTFGDFRLDLSRRELSHNGVAVALKGRPLDILCELAAANGEVVTKDALMARVWPGLVVEENSIQVHISALRKALDERSSGKSFVVTVTGRGYRLIGIAAKPQSSADAVPDAAISERPSIAVLPFQNMSGDPEQEYFADGMVEDIITALSRVRWLLVIARNSSFTYRGRAVDLKQVGAELGVRYVLEGSVRQAGKRGAITSQPIDASSNGDL